MIIGLPGVLGLLVGGVSFGFSGFAFAIFATASLALTHPPQTVVPAVLLVADTLLPLLLYEVRAELRWAVLRRIPPFAPWSVLFVGAGLAAGSFLLGALGPALGRAALGTVVLAFVAFHAGRLARGPGAPGPASAGRWATPGVGFAAGLLDGWLGTGGIAIAISLASRALPRETFLASIGVYFLAADCLRVVVYTLDDYWSWAVVRLYLEAAPIVLLAYAVGVGLRRVFPSPRLFQMVVVGLLAVNGAALLLRTALGR